MKHLALILTIAVAAVAIIITMNLNASAESDRAYMDCVHNLGIDQATDVDEVVAIADRCNAYLD